MSEAVRRIIANRGIGRLRQADGGPTRRAPITAWKHVALRSGWRNATTGEASADFYRDNTGRVNLRGVIEGGTAAAIGTLPAGHRPATIERFAALSPSATVSAVWVYPDGRVIVNDASPPAWISLSGVSFRAEG